VAKPEEKNHVEYLVFIGRIILKEIFDKYGGRS
jgi:hypothetical protein